MIALRKPIVDLMNSFNFNFRLSHCRCIRHRSIQRKAVYLLDNTSFDVKCTHMQMLAFDVTFKLTWSGYPVASGVDNAKHLLPLTVSLTWKSEDDVVWEQVRLNLTPTGIDRDHRTRDPTKVDKDPTRGSGF